MLSRTIRLLGGWAGPQKSPGEVCHRPKSNAAGDVLGRWIDAAFRSSISSVVRLLASISDGVIIPGPKTIGRGGGHAICGQAARGCLVRRSATTSRQPAPPTAGTTRVHDHTSPPYKAPRSSKSARSNILLPFAKRISSREENTYGQDPAHVPRRRGA
jgi:hypothetical protein